MSGHLTGLTRYLTEELGTSDYALPANRRMPRASTGATLIPAYGQEVSDLDPTPLASIDDQPGLYHGDWPGRRLVAVEAPARLMVVNG